MRYYILYPDNTEADTVNDINQLGDDNGFGVFWTDQGMRVLMNVVEKYPDRLENIIIKNDKGETLNVGGFLEKIEKLKVRTQ